MTLLKDEGAVRDRIVRGPALYFTSVTPSTPRAFVGILHGYADHCARYARVMGEWASEGIASVALDMRGHGRAEGTRGHCVRFGEYLDDAAELARLVRDRAEGAPAFLVGHSFGGLVAASSVMGDDGPWKGLVLSAPFFGLALHVQRVKLVAAQVASRILPKLAIPSGLCGKDMTHDPAQATAYDTDPLVFKKATSRWFVEATHAQARVLARARDIRLPLYVVFGGADPVAKLEAGRAVFDRVQSADKTWDARPGLYHEVLNEPEGPAIAQTMARWMLSRLS